MFPPIIVYVFTCLFFVFGRFIDEYCKQHGKYHCLNEAEQKTKYVHDYRQSYREQFKQRFRCKLFAVDIAVKSQCHGKRTRKLFEDQDREQERKWLEERAEVFAKAALFYAGRLDGDKRYGRQRRRYRQHRCRDREQISRSGNKSGIVTHDDKDKK